MPSRRSSTSSSERDAEPTPTTPPPRPRSRPRRAATSRARDALIVHRPVHAAAARLRGPLDPPLGRGDDSPAGSARSCSRSGARRAAVADALRARPTRTTSSAGRIPTTAVGGPGGFDEAPARRRHARRPAGDPGRVRPARARRQPGPPRPLRTVLVTGDSLAQPLDAKVARAFSARHRREGRARRPHRHRHLASPTSSTGARSRSPRCASAQPDAVVVFMGANEGFPLPVRRSGTREVLRRPTGRPRTPTACAG